MTDSAVNTVGSTVSGTRALDAFDNAAHRGNRAFGHVGDRFRQTLPGISDRPV